MFKDSKPAWAAPSSSQPLSVGRTSPHVQPKAPLLQLRAVCSPQGCCLVLALSQSISHQGDRDTATRAPLPSWLSSSHPAALSGRCFACLCIKYNIYIKHSLVSLCPSLPGALGHTSPSQQTPWDPGGVKTPRFCYPQQISISQKNRTDISCAKACKTERSQNLKSKIQN